MHSDELLHILWSTGHTCIDAMSALFLGMLQPPGLEIHLAADKGVVSVTVCTLVTTSLFDIAEVGASRENQVKLVPDLVLCWGFVMKKVLVIERLW